MGQIIGSAAKPKRCNISKLSQLGTPAAGECILVSSDNSMNAAGQGNFDCYIVGDGTKAATASELHKINEEADIVRNLRNDIYGVPSIEFAKNDYQLQPGVITGGIFRSNSVYGTANSYVLIPFAEYRGRTLTLTANTQHYSNEIAFLTTNELVSGESAPYCTNTSSIKTAGNYVVPQDCNYLYVYAERQGADSFPSLSIAGIAASVCSSERADDIEEDVEQGFGDVVQEMGVININGVTGVPAGTYTLSEAIAAVPEELRGPNKIIIYSSFSNGKYFRKIALFNSASYTTGWTTTSNWIEFDFRDWSNVSEVAGAFKMMYNSVSAENGNNVLREILVPFEKMVVAKHSSDSNGRWRILIRYTDGTNEFVDITSSEITTITPNSQKSVLGFCFVLLSTSSTCNIDADVLIGAAEIAFELTYKEDPTAESLGAVPLNQGIGNAGRPLIVGADGKVTIGTATPSTIDGDAVRKVLAKTLYLGNDITSVNTLGTGWSGDVSNGFTHASGNTDALILNSTAEGTGYLIRIESSTNAENLYSVSIGDGPLIDPYNGTTSQQVGIVSDGGNVKITPSTNFTGTIHVKVQACVSEEDAYEIINISVYNVEAENMGNAITAFWNVAIGPDQSTLGNAVSATRNIAIGINALQALETGLQNIGIGTFSLAQLKQGKGNVCVGADTYYRRQGGDFNVAIGKASMGGSTESVNDNVCIGRSAGEKTSGSNNVCIGSVAGYKAAGGCVHIGANAGFSHDAGVNNIFIGINAGYSGSQRTGNWNTVVGPGASAVSGASKSVALGYHANIEKSNQNVIGGSDSLETKVFGDLVVHGTDGVDRRIVFNQDYGISWEVVSE